MPPAARENFLKKVLSGLSQKLFNKLRALEHCYAQGREAY
jgi:hypothetical protein